MAELEWRLTGSARSPRLHADLADQIPSADTYVLVLIDGLGDAQLGHPNAGALDSASKGSIDAPFPTTTTVSMASIATGLLPIEHGLLGHLIWVPELEEIVNSLKWIIPGGSPVEIDTASYLPSPNLWERLTAAGIEAITVQPGQFATTPLTRCLYRGCRFESTWNHADFESAIVELSRTDKRLIFGYLPEIDFAAHLFGHNSAEYAEALRSVEAVWDAIAARLPDRVALIGTGDHGHIDYAPDDKFMIDRRTFAGLTLFGDTRALYAKGAPTAIAQAADSLPATWFPREEMMHWWGPSDDVVPTILDRMPDGVFMADPGRVLIPGHMDKRLIGYHGGLDPRELKIPLLVAEPL